MKQFFEQYGGIALGILALLVLIAMITPVGNLIKTSLQGTVQTFSTGMESQTDTMTNQMSQAFKENNVEKYNPLSDKIRSVQTLYDVGERNLTEDDIVQVEGVDCYVLKREGDKAKLITVDIYDQKYSLTNTASESEYRYLNSVLKSFMDDFYVNILNKNEFILSTTFDAYYTDTYETRTVHYENKDSVTSYVYALEAAEAEQKEGIFGWDNKKLTNIDGSKTSKVVDHFWTSSGYGALDQETPWSGAISCTDSGEIYTYWTTGSRGGARPVFWMQLT